MHLHIFKRGFSIQSIENFWVKDPKTYYKIYANAYICIYFSSAVGANFSFHPAYRRQEQGKQGDNK